MNKKTFALLAFLLCTIIGCNSSQPVRDCPIETLFLDESAFPSSVLLDRIYSPTSESTESGTRTFLLGEDVGLQGVFRFSSSSNAHRFFRQKRKTFFEEDDITTTDFYFDDHANRYYVACSQQSGLKSCTMIAQYEEYFVTLSADISETDVTSDIFLNLIMTIDSRMTECFHK